LSELISSVELSMSEAADLLDPPVERDDTKHHVSHLVNEAVRIIGNGKAYDGEPTQWGWNIMALGRIAEAVVRPIVQREADKRGWRFTPQVVSEVDGIVGSLDGLLVSDAGVEAVVEVKSRHSSPSDPRDNWRYMAQVQAYCRMAFTQVAWMPILYLPRRGPPNAELHLHVIQFEVQELVENWEMLRNIRGERKYDHVGGP